MVVGGEGRPRESRAAESSAVAPANYRTVAAGDPLPDPQSSIGALFGFTSRVGTDYGAWPGIVYRALLELCVLSGRPLRPRQAGPLALSLHLGFEPNAANRKRLSRAVDKLEREGLIHRDTDTLSVPHASLLCGQQVVAPTHLTAVSGSRCPSGVPDTSLDVPPDAPQAPYRGRGARPAGAGLVERPPGPTASGDLDPELLDRLRRMSDQALAEIASNPDGRLSAAALRLLEIRRRLGAERPER